MLVPKKSRKPGRETSLASVSELAAGLPDEALQSLLEFTEFLASKYPAKDQVPDLEIVPIERPQMESVIAAIRRLAKTYPMLDKNLLFQQTSQAMSDHVLREVSDEESIDRLEAVFLKEYEALVKKHQG